jgi:hypothetical protein
VRVETPVADPTVAENDAGIVTRGNVSDVVEPRRVTAAQDAAVGNGLARDDSSTARSVIEPTSNAANPPGLALSHDTIAASAREWPPIDTRVPETMAADPSSLREPYTQTAYAGVIYLVNLALHLGLYGDFTQPLRAGLELPVGDFLALVGARACGATFDADPIRGLLARMAWRSPDDPPADGIEPPDGLDLSQWIERLAATLEARAAFVLDVDEGTALPFLCAQPGRMAVSAARVDVAFPLVAHPLSIRIAGLDRNPGWVPAAGRIFELRYE